MRRTQLSAFDLAGRAEIEEPTFLITRPIGTRFLSALRDDLTPLGTNGVAVLDFTGIYLMDGSFADEVFGTLGSERTRKKTGSPRLVLSSLNDASRDNLQYALETRTRREHQLRNLVFPVLDTLGKILLIGACEDNIRETFELLQQKRELTARDVQEYFKRQELAINAASTRLKAVYDLGLALRSAQREAPGGQYTYRLPV